MKVTIYGEQTVYYAYEADYDELLSLDYEHKLPSAEQVEQQGGFDPRLLTQEMREAFADTAYEVDSSAMEWTEIKVEDE